jgi:hypothetical protein
LALHPQGKDPTVINFDEWRDLNHPKVYENNPFKIVVCSLREPNIFWLWQARSKLKYPDFVRGYIYETVLGLPLALMCLVKKT